MCCFLFSIMIHVLLAGKQIRKTFSCCISITFLFRKWFNDEAKESSPKLTSKAVENTDTRCNSEDNKIISSIGASMNSGPMWMTKEDTSSGTQTATHITLPNINTNVTDGVSNKIVIPKISNKEFSVYVSYPTCVLKYCVYSLLSL